MPDRGAKSHQNTARTVARVVNNATNTAVEKFDDSLVRVANVLFNEFVVTKAAMAQNQAEIISRMDADKDAARKSQAEIMSRLHANEDAATSRHAELTKATDDMCAFIAAMNAKNAEKDAAMAAAMAAARAARAARAAAKK